MATVASHVPFIDLCALCERISKKKGKLKKKPLEDFIERWRKFHNELHVKVPNTADSFYPALRLLLPQCERERAAYGIKEITLAKLYIEILCLSKESQDAQKLLNYRAPKTAKGEAGDFASVAYFVLKKRCPEKGSLKISDINSHLDNISTSNASKTKAEVKKSLQILLRNTSALEQKWLIRMIMKDMKMGISEQSILGTYHPDAKDLYNVTNNLEKVCTQLKDPSVRLHEIEISLFTPFRPMLGEQALPEQVEKRMQNQPFVIEVKYDGERVQLHKQENMYKYFSRAGHDCTAVYGSSPLEGTLTPFISNCFKSNVSNCILDGEMVIYSSKLNCIVSKGENADIKALEPDGDYGPCFCVFDILMLNNKVLSNLPLNERLSYLKDVFTPIENRIRTTEQTAASTREDVIKALNEAIDNREEGIVIKNPLSVYRPNTRKGGGWLKVKPDYIDNLMDELDLLIIGGSFGEGRRAKIISHFLLAVAAPSGNPDDKPSTFYSVAKVGSGYSMKELNELLGNLSQHWQVFNPRNPPKNIVIGGGRKERPDVWIEPSKSHIVQVRAAEIVQSDRFATGCTLRFPRVEKIRYDKHWYQCMTTTELEDMRQQAKGKLATRNYVAFEEDEPSPKKRHIAHQVRHITVAPQFRPADTSNVQQVSELFRDKEICVILTSPQKKQSLEKQIVEYGGSFVQNPGPGTFCVLADKLSLKVNNIIKTKLYDVVKSDWLQSCIEKKQLISWIPNDMFHSTPLTLEKFSEEYDDYGDSYTIDATEDSIKAAFGNIKKKEWESQSISREKMAELEFNYFPNSSPLGLFRICKLYVDDKLCIGDPSTAYSDYNMQLISFKLRLYGAELTSGIDETTTHVVVHQRDLSRLQELKNINKTRVKGRFHIVTEQWVEQCVAKIKLLQERYYQPLEEHEN